MLYRATMPLGFVAGQATAAGAPATAIVSTASLPFISGGTGGFVAVARFGLVETTARVPGTSLIATASVDVAAGATTALDRAPGAVATATVTPADGAIAVSPGAQVEIAVSNTIPAATIDAPTVRLLDVGSADVEPGAGARVAARVVLSGSHAGGRAAGADRGRPGFRLEASGLADVFGGAIVVPAVTFETNADEAPVYDVDKLVVSFPDMNGFVR